jgi:hypothetical protein
MPTKRLSVPFDSEEYAAIKEVKGERTWQEAVLEEFGVAES